MKLFVVLAPARAGVYWLAAMWILRVTANSFAADIDPSIPPELPPRIPQTQMGITQLPNDKLDWLLDAKFGLFIHWGLYSGPGLGERVLQNQGITTEKYRR